MRFLVDTHVWLWLLESPDKLQVEQLVLVTADDAVRRYGGRVQWAT